MSNAIKTIYDDRDFFQSTLSKIRLLGLSPIALKPHLFGSGVCSCTDPDECHQLGKRPRPTADGKWDHKPLFGDGLGVLASAGIIFLDLDIKPGEGDGFATLENLNIILPSTRNQKTKNGCHYALKVPENIKQAESKIKNGTNIYGPKSCVDMRADGSYIRLYPNEKGEYDLLNSDISIADAPGEILQAVIPHKFSDTDKPSVNPLSHSKNFEVSTDRAQSRRLEGAELEAAITDLKAFPTASTGGGGVNLAGAVRLLTRGWLMLPTQVDEVLREYYNPNCKPPWDLNNQDDLKNWKHTLQKAPEEGEPWGNRLRTLANKGNNDLSIEHAKAHIAQSMLRIKEGDSGAPFEKAFIEALRVIQQENLADYMRVRDEIKKANPKVNITWMDKSVNSDREIINAAVADELVLLAQERCTLFHNNEREPYAAFDTNGHREIWNLQKDGFIEWLSHEYYKEKGRAPAKNSIDTAIATLSGQAKFGGNEKFVYIRVANYDDAYWVDLCNDQWQAVKITSQGWEIIDNPPVMFTRSPTMRALSIPIQGGDIKPLFNMINIPESERLLLLAWLLECLRPETPYAVLELIGEQGSAKSSTQNILRNIIDPNQSNLRHIPKNREDVFVTARNAHLVSYENVSHVPADYQDALCVLATGGGFATRTLYTNSDETVLDLKKPVVLNGISVIVTAQDLLDRTVHIALPSITERKTSQDLKRQFDQHKAGILGGLFDLFARVLKILPTVNIPPEQLPRMADFAYLGEAIYRAHEYPHGVFIEHYSQMRRDGVHRTLEASPVAIAILEYLNRNSSGFDGTVKKLYETLTSFKADGESWPRSPKGFADAFRRVAPSLRQIGINAKISDRPSREGYMCLLKRKVEPFLPVETLYEVHNVHNVHTLGKNAPINGANSTICELGELGELAREFEVKKKGASNNSDRETSMLRNTVGDLPSNVERF